MRLQARQQYQRKQGGFSKAKVNKDCWLSCSRFDADKIKVVDLVPMWDIHFRVGLNDSCGFLQTQNIL